jgi:ABC-type branched-subunit amino acid transport system substrate-binding protein
MDITKYQSQSDCTLNAAPLDRLATLVTYAQDKGGHLEPDEVLALAAAAKDAVESLFADIEQASKDGFQDAILEMFLAKGNA